MTVKCVCEASVRCILIFFSVNQSVWVLLTFDYVVASFLYWFFSFRDISILITLFVWWLNTSADTKLCKIVINSQPVYTSYGFWRFSFLIKRRSYMNFTVLSLFIYLERTSMEDAASKPSWTPKMITQLNSSTHQILKLIQIRIIKTG